MSAIGFKVEVDRFTVQGDPGIFEADIEVALTLPGPVALSGPSLTPYQLGSPGSQAIRNGPWPGLAATPRSLRRFRRRCRAGRTPIPPGPGHPGPGRRRPQQRGPLHASVGGRSGVGHSGEAAQVKGTRATRWPSRSAWTSPGQASRTASRPTAHPGATRSTGPQTPSTCWSSGPTRQPRSLSPGVPPGPGPRSPPKNGSRQR